MKELRPGIFGTPDFFSKELLDSLPMNYKSPPGGKYKFDSKKGLKQVKNIMDGLKIAAYYGGPEQQKKDELRKAIEAFGKAADNPNTVDAVLQLFGADKDSSPLIKGFIN